MKLSHYLYTALVCLSATTAAVHPATASAAPAAESVADASVQAGAKAVASGIEIYNNTADALAAEVYSITGTAVWQSAVEAGSSVRLELKAGLYIVRVGDSATRILVR